MINYDAHLSRAAGKMQESAIRRMGTVLAQGRDIISFAPGHPASDTFLWADFQEIIRELLSDSDESVLQYGPTRGYRPLLECIGAIMQSRGAETTAERLYEACRRGLLDRQLPVLRAYYQRKRDAMVSALREAFGAELRWPEPRGGFFLWATLPDGVDTAAMVARAVERGVIYVAGDAFFVDGSGSTHLRLSFSAPTPDRIREGVRRLAATVREELAATMARP